MSNTRGRRRTHVRSYIRRDGTRVSSYTQNRRRGRQNTKSTSRRPPATFSSPIFDLKRYESERDLENQKREKLRAQRAEQDAQRELRKQEEDQIKLAADFCRTTIEEGVINATADNITERVNEKTWATLRRKWRTFRCRWLAQLAQKILDTKSQIHTSIADVAALKWWAPLHNPERVFFHQLVKSIPLPGDQQFEAAAHGLRLTGVCLCCMQGRRLDKCECFRALAKQYTKEEIRSFLVSTGTDWMQGPGR